jgi:hypothetical protein
LPSLPPAEEWLAPPETVERNQGKVERSPKKVERIPPG